MTSEMRELFNLAATFAAVVTATFMFSICLWIAGYWILSTAIESVNSYDDRSNPDSYHVVDRKEVGRR